MKSLDIAVVVSQLMTSAGPDGTPLYCAAGSQMGQNQPEHSPVQVQGASARHLLPGQHI